MLCSGKSIRIFSSALNTDLKLTKLSGETAASIFKFFFQMNCIFLFPSV